MPSQNEIRQQITNSIIESLKEGTIPWKQPWSMDPNAGRPRNGSTMRSYNGVNILLLMLHNHRHGFTSRHFATYNQWQTLGGQVMRRPSVGGREPEDDGFDGDDVGGSLSDQDGPVQELWQDPAKDLGAR